jgi:hypothetical protein
MSGKNGDRSRHDRQRKSKMHDREKIRELRKGLSQPVPQQAISQTKSK